MKVTTTTTVTPANEVLGKKEKTLYYLIIENKAGEKHLMNVGKETHDKIIEMNKKDK